MPTTDEVRENPDFYFRRGIHDVIILLGGKKEIAVLIEKVLLDKPATLEDQRVLSQYAIDLMGEQKTKLCNVHTIKIKTAGPDEQE